ncbi:hypothetical protein [Myceligenerans salitolerans]|uniref:Uncharacterized protein n=1 Tax=Myceligenerans salitolerans TaxID=1230528 RepID=A0ABS3I834_9MICO|nr:hypothetical protein [Myceligenerans salitolerans]MBO0609175.1 hypothetical protein [Myceligenerans salitolerans]
MARDLRGRLRKEGVLYPGRQTNHIRPAGWLVGLPVPFTPDPGPRREWWESVRDEIEGAGDKRVLFSDERICWADIDGARRVVEGLGQPAHGVLVVRNLASYSPSVWQQNLKGGALESLDEHLREVFSKPDLSKMSPPFHRRDGRGLVERWTEVLGPENLTVIVLEKEHPDRLLSTFEQMLGLPETMLTGASAAKGSNRGLSTTEAALLMALNRRVLEEWRASRNQQRDLIFRGAAARLVGARKPGPDEERVGMPQWAVEAAAEAGGKFAESIRAAGVRVIGDLGELTRMGPSSEKDPTVLPEMIPSDIALEALSGMFAAASGWNWKHTKRWPPRPASAKKRPQPPADPETVLQTVPTKTLASVLARRVAQRAQRVVGRR